MPRPAILRHPAALLVFPLLGVALLLAGCSVPQTSGPRQRAGLIVVHGDGNLRTACVAFDEQEISGTDLIDRSSLSSSLDPTNPMGVLVCALDGEGCSYPAEKCLCACDQPGECTYWAYFTLSDDGTWAYSPLGPSMRRLADGDLDAWVWLAGTGQSGPATIPVPPLTFAEVCPAE